MKSGKAHVLAILTALFLILPAAPVLSSDSILIMATTTSTDNTGLLDYLAPEFKKSTGIRLRWVAVGTGKALALGRNCDVSILFVHAPGAEKEFIEKGYGVSRRKVMYNRFILVGPKHDPAGIENMDALYALKAISKKKAIFVSRGDNSGTHKKELSIWKAAALEVPEKEDWYIQAGQGMLASLNLAAERYGYTLVDGGTYIKYQSNLKGEPPLVILSDQGSSLLNQYSVIAINPDRCENVQHEAALTFIRWVASAEAQALISNFRLLGQRLFTPNAN